MKLSGGSQMYLEHFLFEGAAVLWGLWQLWQVRPGAKDKTEAPAEPQTKDAPSSET